MTKEEAESRIKHGTDSEGYPGAMCGRCGAVWHCDVSRVKSERVKCLGCGTWLMVPQPLEEGESEKVTLKHDDNLGVNLVTDIIYTIEGCLIGDRVVDNALRAAYLLAKNLLTYRRSFATTPVLPKTGRPAIDGGHKTVTIRWKAIQTEVIDPDNPETTFPVLEGVVLIEREGDVGGVKAEWVTGEFGMDFLRVRGEVRGCRFNKKIYPIKLFNDSIMSAIGGVVLHAAGEDPESIVYVDVAPEEEFAKHLRE